MGTHTFKHSFGSGADLAEMTASVDRMWALSRPGPIDDILGRLLRCNQTVVNFQVTPGDATLYDIVVVHFPDRHDGPWYVGVSPSRFPYWFNATADDLPHPEYVARSLGMAGAEGPIVVAMYVQNAIFTGLTGEALADHR